MTVSELRQWLDQWRECNDAIPENKVHICVRIDAQDTDENPYAGLYSSAFNIGYDLYDIWKIDLDDNKLIIRLNKSPIDETLPKL